jgi:hypothetical protein
MNPKLLHEKTILKQPIKNVKNLSP